MYLYLHGRRVPNVYTHVRHFAGCGILKMSIPTFIDIDVADQVSTQHIK